MFVVWDLYNLMFINIVQSFSYLWRINKYQQKIDMNLNHISLTAIILKCLGIVQSVSWFLHLCLTKQLSNEREIPCSRFLSQSKLLRWNKNAKKNIFRKQCKQRMVCTTTIARNRSHPESRHSLGTAPYEGDQNQL